MEKAIIAGGCFWCIEAAFEKVDGVISAVSGYTGGSKPNPTYEEVCSGATGHYEAVEVTFDPAKISYEQILNIYWRNIDPTDSSGQFADKGNQYHSAIFYLSDKQKKQAEASKKLLAASDVFKNTIVTKILPAATFYRAEEYHQDYALKNAGHYKAYSVGSGRVEFLKKAWKDLPDACPIAKPAPIKEKQLTELQRHVTQECGTEPAFNNEYWDNHKAGIYVDIVSGEVLFLSRDKFDSGTGWPSFTRPVVTANVVEKVDKAYGMVRTEVRSAGADSHLGHVFDDGPDGKRRYCINSAAMRFVPREDMAREGY